MGVGVCVGPGGCGGGSCAGVVVAVGREFVAACNPSILSFFLTFCTQPDLVIMTQQDSLLHRGSVGGPVGKSVRTEMCRMGPCGFLRGFLGDSGTSGDG